MSVVFLGKLKGRKIINFIETELGVKKVYGEPVELDVYFDPVTCETKVYLDGKELTSTWCSSDLYTQLLKNDIEQDLNNLPKIGNIWIPEEVEEAKKELEEISKRGSVIIHSGEDLTIRAVRKVSESEYEEYKIEFKEGNDFAYITKARYFIVNVNGKENIRMIWEGHFMNFFQE